MNYPKLLEVCVTQEHIDRGEPLKTHACPVALAFADALRSRGFPVKHVSVYGEAGAYETDGTDPDDEVATYNAASATAWQADYDSGMTVLPATFIFTLNRSKPGTGTKGDRT